MKISLVRILALEHNCLVNEDWSSGSFGTFWTAEDNWVINGQFGNPYPSAEFEWDPVMTNYTAYLTSDLINGVFMDSTKQDYLDGQFILAFDLAFENNGMSGTEFLLVEIWSDDEWINLAEYSNAEPSYDFKNEMLDITEYALGHVFKLRFMAEGENSANILSWFVDNIEIYHYCAPPLDLMIEPISYPELQLSWYPPEAVCSGYNVYLSVDNDPFQLIANTLDTTYIYNYEEGNWICFVATAIYESCESEFSDAACTWVGIDEYGEADEIWIYPNPANTEINIECKASMDKLCLLDLSGRELYCRKLHKQNQSTLDVSAYEAGIYLLRIDTEKGRFARKIVVAR